MSLRPVSHDDCTDLTCYAVEKAIASVLFNPEYRGVLSILKGMRNGVVYGTKIRFPHALVMTMVFKNGT